VALDPFRATHGPPAGFAQASNACKEDEMRVLGALKENLAAQAVIRAFSLEQAGLAGFRKRNDPAVPQHDARRAHFRVPGKVHRHRHPLYSDIGSRSERLARFRKEITIGSLVAMPMLAVTLSKSLLFMGEYMPSIGAAKAAYRRIEDVLEAPRAMEDSPDARFLPPASH